MSVEKQLWTLNSYLIKTLPFYILSMPKIYLNELLQDTNIIVFERGKGNIKLEQPIEIDGLTYGYMDWGLFSNLLRTHVDLFKHWRIDMAEDVYDAFNRKFNFNDKTIERFKYYMLLLFLSAWKRNPEWVDGSLVEAWKMDVMQDIVNENLKITPYGKDGIYNMEKLYDKEDITRIILDANLNSGNVGVNSTTSRATYDTFISQKYRIPSVKRNRILGNALIKVNMLVEPSMNMKYFWEDYNYIIPILFLSKEKKHFRLLNYTRELFDQIK